MIGRGVFLRWHRGYSSSADLNFGLMFDIDGVLVRGKKVLPFTPQAFKRLTHPITGKFIVPTVFVTNAGNSLRQSKAENLSEWLGARVNEDQVIMSHSPLKTFTSYHDKHVLVSGQGPIRDIAKNLGFSKITTIDELREAFPTLDAVDHQRRRAAPCAFEKFFPQIEAIVLFGEPVRWETSLQLTLDVLLMDGLPHRAPDVVKYPHLPVLACNMDLQWMAEAVMPRFGHGAYLLCLENLYKKITGRDFIYTALVGKPSEITYRHSEGMLQSQARDLGISKPLKRIYFVGDNICTDIFGANLYNNYLSKLRESRERLVVASELVIDNRTRSIDSLLGTEELYGADNCYSVLVETGVFSKERENSATLDHSPRDFLPVQDSFREPTYVVKNVLEAVNLIFNRESFSSK